MGLAELAQSAQSLLITPVVTGLPAAVSRLCAQENARNRQRILRCGAALSLFISIPLAAAAFLLREPLSLWLGDVRTLPALMIYLPCLPILGVSCALNGFYYGCGRPLPPALSELLEQGVRFLLCMQLAALLGGWPVMLRSAIPAAGALAGEAIGLALMLILGARALFGRAPGRLTRTRLKVMADITALALPLTIMRLVSSLMRTASATILPRRLQFSGLAAGEALSQMGVMQGMMMPVVLLPSFITSSLCSVAAPELARRQAQGRPLEGIVRRSMALTLGVGLFAMAGVWLFAPLIAHTLYRQAELLPMLRFGCALVPLTALTHVASGLMNGLALQGVSLRISLISNFLYAVLMYLLPGIRGLRIYGAIIAGFCAQGVTLALSLRALRRHLSPECTSR